MIVLLPIDSILLADYEKGFFELVRICNFKIRLEIR